MIYHHWSFSMIYGIYSVTGKALFDLISSGITLVYSSNDTLIWIEFWWGWYIWVCLVETWHTLGVVCCACTSEAVKAFGSFDTLLETCFDWQQLLEFEYIGMWSLVVCLPVISLEDKLLVVEISSIGVPYSGQKRHGCVDLKTLFGQKQCCVCFQHIYLGFGCGHCFCIRSTVDLYRFCVLLLHMDVGGVRQYTR